MLGVSLLGNVQISFDVLGRDVVFSNRQSAVTWGRRLWPNRHITYIVAEKASQFLLLYLWYMWGEKLVKHVIWGGRGLAEKVKIPSYGEEEV